MKLPRWELASIDRRKILGYLLAIDSPDGRSKAEFFLRCGFDPMKWNEFDEAIRKHASAHDVSAVKDSRHGTRYIVEGLLDTPMGGRRLVRVVWILEHGSSAPRLVTAYPLKERRQ